MDTQKSTPQARFDLTGSFDHDQSTEPGTTPIPNLQYSPRLRERAFGHSDKATWVDEFHVWRNSTASGLERHEEHVQLGRFEIHFVEAGQHRVEADAQDVTMQGGQAYLLRQFDQHTILSPLKIGKICVSIPKARYARLMAAEYMEPGATLAAFQPVADIDCPGLRNLRHLADLLMSLGSCEKTSWQTSVGAHLLTEAFLALFIEGWPRDGAHRSSHVAKPFYVKRAVDWVHEHAAGKILLEDLASASGVSVRTLQLGFQKFIGLSPMGYVLKVRLQHAYSDLLNEPTVTVDEVAARWGFPSSSKFAAQIRSQYGHNPSDLRRLFQIRRRQQD